MKKNLIAVIILAVLVVNTVMTGIMMFVVIPANQKTMELVGDIAAAIQLDLGIAGSGTVETATNNVAIADIAPYNLTEELTIKLKNDSENGDTGDHYAVVGVTLSLNTKDDDYKAYSETIATQEGLIKDKIIGVIGSYTYAEASSANTSDIQAKILEELQTAYNSKFICGVSFSKWLLQ